MNIVDLLERQVQKWNEEQKCGFCWTFGAPLTESAANLQQPREDSKCCVQVLFLQDKVVPFSTTNVYNQFTGLRERAVCTRNFQILFLLPEDLGRNNYNEISGHEVSQSKWAMTLQRLQECLSCDVHFDFCELIGREYQLTQWSAKQEINLFDDIYSGYRVTAAIQTVV